MFDKATVMVLISDKDYHATLRILRGEQKLPQVFIELKDWLKNKYGVTAYNFVYRKSKHNNPKCLFELCIILSSADDCRRMLRGHNYDTEKQKEISGKFCELALKFDFAKPENARNVFVCYNDFSEEMKTDVNYRAHRKVKKALLEKYRENAIWQICPSFSNVVVFYQTDEDVRKNRENGVSKAIKDAYYAEISNQDEFHVFTEDTFAMDFDSKENLDKNYQGNLYYYFK